MTLASTDGSPPTAHYGFTRVGAGEDLSKDGYAALTRDRDMLDNLLFALVNREFTGDPPLGDPTDPPEFVLGGGGSLPAGRTFYYTISYLDAFGLETAASPEDSIDTPAPIDAPTAPALSVSSTGGTIGPGTYNYVITQVDVYGGETDASPLSSIQVPSGATNSIVLDLPDLDAAAVATRVYRSRPGQSALYYLAQTSSDTLTDTGTAEDGTRLVPSVNTTNSTNAVTITVPGDFIPEQAVAWRVYRTEDPGIYDSSSMVHEVVEPESPSSTIPTTVYIDLGDALLDGQPRDISATVAAAPKLNLANLIGILPLTAVPRGARCLSAFQAGAVADGDVLNVTEVPSDVVPVRFTVFWQGAPTTGNPIARISDGTTDIDLTCSAANHRGGDPAGFWRMEYPLMLAATFEAEDGTRSDIDIPIDNDLAAVNSQAVQLANDTEYVEVDLDELDPGSFSTFVRLRVIAFDTGLPGDDITISAIRTDTDAVLAFVDVDLESTTPSNPDDTPEDFVYQEIVGPVFTAPGGVDIVLRVAKVTASTQSYDIDNMRYETSVPSLDAGVVTVSVHSGGATDGTDPTVNVWF